MKELLDYLIQLEKDFDNGCYSVKEYYDFIHDIKHVIIKNNLSKF